VSVVSRPRGAGLQPAAPEVVWPPQGRLSDHVEVVFSCVSTSSTTR